MVFPPLPRQSIVIHYFWLCPRNIDSNSWFKTSQNLNQQWQQQPLIYFYFWHIFLCQFFDNTFACVHFLTPHHPLRQSSQSNHKTSRNRYPPPPFIESIVLSHCPAAISPLLHLCVCPSRWWIFSGFTAARGFCLRVFTFPPKSAHEHPITQKSPLNSTIGGFLNRKWQNLSTAPDDCIRQQRFVERCLGSLQRGDFVRGWLLVYT